MANNSEIVKLAELIKDVKIAMLVTNEGDVLRSRPMATQQIKEDGLIWFFTKRDSHKTQEVDEATQVNVSYSDTSNDLYVSVSGAATMVYDKSTIAKLWTPELKAWFPKGQDDPEVALIKIKIEQAEYWDTPDNKMVQIIGFVKSVLTGTEYQPGENKKINV